MFTRHTVALAAAVAATTCSLSTPAAATPPPFNAPVCTQSGKELGSGHAPGLVKAAAHSPNLVPCPPYPGGGETPT